MDHGLQDAYGKEAVLIRLILFLEDALPINGKRALSFLEDALFMENEHLSFYLFIYLFIYLFSYFVFYACLGH